ncbi:uncharacterized protein J3R85_008664 [Psidium guajava]|nr:uncharacterized protein J3R85_008664 [Psidium guajava]
MGLETPCCPYRSLSFIYQKKSTRAGLPLGPAMSKREKTHPPLSLFRPHVAMLSIKLGDVF